MDACKSVIFVSIGKANFTDHHTYTVKGFKDSVLVCKIHDCYCTVQYAKILSISIPYHQAFSSSDASVCNG